MYDYSSLVRRYSPLAAAAMVTTPVIIAAAGPMLSREPAALEVSQKLL
jgi:hypothetical protein